MPSLKSSMIDLDPERYQPMSPASPAAMQQQVPPELPIAIRRSPVMISSLPSISTASDGISRQFYGGAHVPTRRLVLP